MTSAPRTDQDHAKIAAGRYAAEKYCFPGAKIGLGSGTTSHFFVRALAEMVRDGLEVVGVPTSTSTRDLALRLGVPLAELDEIGQLDVCIDGPDEIDPDGTMIKGGGACLLWEKLVATTSAKMVVVADNSKAVSALGAFPLPVEVVRFSWGTTRTAIRAVLARHGYPSDLAMPRRERDGSPVVTDNGNFIIDAHLGKARDIAELTVELNTVPGVVENGFFAGIADEVVFGWPDGSAATYTFPFTTPLAKPDTAQR